MPYTRRMNWGTLVKDLIDSGMTQEQIAAACGRSQPTISALLSGNTREPLGGTAIKLLELREGVSKKRNGSRKRA